MQILTIETNSTLNTKSANQEYGAVNKLCKLCSNYVVETYHLSLQIISGCLYW